MSPEQAAQDSALDCLNPENDPTGVDTAVLRDRLRRFATLAATLAPLDAESARTLAIHLLTNQNVPDARRLVAAAFREVISSRNGKSEGEPQLQGRTLDFHDPDPWPEEVDGADLLERILKFIVRFLRLPPGADLLLATFVLYTYCRDAFPVAPYLVAHSPAPQCGKTRLLETLELLAFRPWRTITPSTAVLFRVIEEHRPLLLLDEAEVVNTRTPAAQDVVALLQAGYRKGSAVPRCVGVDLEVRMFHPFGPKVFALVGHELPPALFDRCIPIVMERRQREEGLERFRPRHLEAEASGLRQQAMRWAIDNHDRLAALEAPPIESISERQEEVWGPLLAVATAAGGSWYPVVREAAEHLSGGRTTTTTAVDLLLDIRGVFEVKGVDRVRSADLASALNEVEGHPWADWNRGKGITANEVARKLREFSIIPGTVRFGAGQGDTAKGYYRSQFLEAWGRYVPTVTASQASIEADDLGTGDRHKERDGNGQIVAELRDCDGVTGNGRHQPGGAEP